MTDRVRVAIVGVGNCASSLVQGVQFVRTFGDEAAGLIHRSICGLVAADVQFVAAFDVDERKVGQPLSRAIVAPPNNTRHLCTVPPTDGEPTVLRGPVMDGVAAHMRRAFSVNRKRKPVDVAGALRQAKAEVVLIYLPVGSERAARWYAEQALAARCAVVNCIPVFLASDKALVQRFRRARLPIVGDDVKSQVGATIVHRVLANLMTQRGYRTVNTYQLNVGGNTDFENMLARDRLVSKKLSKTRAVTSQLREQLAAESVHVGPSDHVPFLLDQKVAFMRLEAVGFCGAPMEVELRLCVHDSPNSAGVVMDALRYAAAAKRAGVGGALALPSAACMKSPPQMNHRADTELWAELEKWRPR